jgi:hypothetical protein
VSPDAIYFGDNLADETVVLHSVVLHSVVFYVNLNYTTFQGPFFFTRHSSVALT